MEINPPLRLARKRLRQNFKIEIKDREEIMMEILQRCSTKELGRMKCVSKHWYSIISKPMFCYKHHNFHPSEAGTNAIVTGLVLYKLIGKLRPRMNFVFLNGQTLKTSSPFPISLPMVDVKSDIKRIWSCNGLFCVCVIKYGFFPYGNNLTYYITNPTTNQTAELPDFQKPVTANVLSLNLAFDPLKSPYYKVVCVWIYEAEYHFSVYSSETKDWEIQESASLDTDVNYDFMFKEGVFCANAINWVSRTGPFLRFDFKNKRAKTITATHIRNDQKRRWIEYFGTSGNELYLIEVHGGEHQQFDILQYKEKYYKWVLRYRIDLKKFGIGEDMWFGRSRGVRILSLMLSEKEKGGREGDGLLRIVIATPEMIYQCDLLKGGGKRTLVPCVVHDKNQKNLNGYSWLDAHHFTASISSV